MHRAARQNKKCRLIQPAAETGATEPGAVAEAGVDDAPVNVEAAGAAGEATTEAGAGALAAVAPETAVAGAGAGDP